MPNSGKEVFKVYLGFGSILTLLFGLVAFAFGSFYLLAQAIERNIHTYQVLDAAQDVRVAAVNIQTGFRGFVLTGDPQFLEPYERGEREYVAGIERLRQLTIDNPAQQARIARASEVSEHWRASHIAPGIAVRRQIGTNSVELDDLMLLVNPIRGKLFLDSLEGILTEIREEEQNLLDTRSERVSGLERLTQTTLMLGGLFGLLTAGVFGVIGITKSRNLIRSNEQLLAEMAERNRAEAELARLSRSNALILQAAGDGILGLDAQGRITFLNPAAAQMIGWDSGEVIGKQAHDVMHHTRPDGSQFPEDECPIQASLRDGVIHASDDEFFWNRDGRSFPVEYIANPITEDGQIVGGVVTFRDVTERREVEKMKDEFVSVVSHELRTPLTSIRGSLGLLASGMLGSLPERGQRMLEIAAQNTDRLVRLINDILDIERIESGQITMSPRLVQVEKIVSEATETVAGMAEKSQISLEASFVDAEVHADSDRVVQVLTNLLSNAIKFSPKGDTVSLTASIEDGMVHFTVADTGRGIPADKHESIFERFQQVDASDSREKGGTGLGLAIARSIVVQHGGRIWVESEPGSGSRFHFTLPLVQTKRPSERRQPVILLCDDDEVTREVVGERVRGRGFTVHTAASGAAAIDIARRESPDAILLDLAMPGMDGAETMMLLKEDQKTRDIPIIIFSTTPPSINVEAGDISDEWVTKASDESSLFDALQRVLSRQSRTGRILLIEDDLDLAEVLSAMFHRKGLTVLHAESCNEAIEQSRHSPPDLVVLDILLRGSDGFQVVECLRQVDVLRSIPLVVYSALDLNDEQRQRLRLGPTEFMTKGRISPAELEERVVTLLDKLLIPRTTD